MTTERRRVTIHDRTPVGRTRQPLWQLLAWLLVLVELYDGGVLAFGSERFFSSPTYYAVRSIGLRPLGWAALALAVALVYQLGRPTRGLLIITLVVGFAYELFWLFGIVYSWISEGVGGLTAPSKSAALAAIFCFLALRVEERRKGLG
jgi:hypothetical protein